MKKTAVLKRFSKDYYREWVASMKKAKIKNLSLKDAYDAGWSDAEYNREDLPPLLQKLKSVCFICGKRHIFTCGTPIIKMGGCCVSAEYNGTTYLLSRVADLRCYLDYWKTHRKMPKLNLSQKEAEQAVKKSLKVRL